jgi:hypothetical protein
MTDFERGYEQGKADAAKKMHPEIRKCLEDYFDKCFSSYQEGLETYREGILVGPCFCRKWPGGVPPLRQWVGLTDDEADEVYMTAQKQINEHWENGGTTIMFPTMLYKAIEAKLREKNK